MTRLRWFGVSGVKQSRSDSHLESMGCGVSNRPEMILAGAFCVLRVSSVMEAARAQLGRHRNLRFPEQVPFVAGAPHLGWAGREPGGCARLRRLWMPFRVPFSGRVKAQAAFELFEVVQRLWLHRAERVYSRRRLAAIAHAERAADAPRVEDYELDRDHA